MKESFNNDWTFPSQTMYHMQFPPPPPHPHPLPPREREYESLLFMPMTDNRILRHNYDKYREKHMRKYIGKILFLL